MFMFLVQLICGIAQANDLAPIKADDLDGRRGLLLEPCEEGDSDDEEEQGGFEEEQG